MDPFPRLPPKWCILSVFEIAGDQLMSGLSFADWSKEKLGSELGIRDKVWSFRVQASRVRRKWGNESPHKFQKSSRASYSPARILSRFNPALLTHPFTLALFLCVPSWLLIFIHQLCSIYSSSSL